MYVALGLLWLVLGNLLLLLLLFLLFMEKETAQAYSCQLYETQVAVGRVDIS